jgi:hypothetical protein
MNDNFPSGKSNLNFSASTTAERPILIHPEYEVVESISRDAAGILYRVKHLKTEKMLGLKVFSANVSPGISSIDTGSKKVNGIVCFQTPMRTLNGQKCAAVDLPGGQCLETICSVTEFP